MYCKVVILAVVCFAVLIAADDDDRSGGEERGEEGGGRGGGKRGRGEGRDGRHKGGGGPGCGFEKLKKCCPSLPEIMKQESITECTPASAGAPPPPGPPPGGEGERGPPGGPHHGGFKNRSCMMECAFSANGFTTTGADGKVVLNMEALNAKLTAVATGPWASVITATQANCTSAAPVVDQNQTCTSGSNEVAHCLLRQMIPNCPDLVDSKECKKQVSRITEDRHGPGGKRGGGGKRRRAGGDEGGGRDDGEDDGEEGGEGGRRGHRKGGRKGGRDGNNEDGEGSRGGRRGQKDD